MKINIPTLLTLSRIAVIPVFIGIYLIDTSWSYKICAWLFVAAAITDWLDGYLARRYKQTSRFGAFLDPVADKLMVTVVLVLLVYKSPSHYMEGFIAFAAIIIIGREIAISALREWMAEVGARAKVKVSIIGKYKTAFQLTALPCLIYKEKLLGIPVTDIGFILLYLAVGLTLWSMTIYVRDAWPTLKRSASSE